MAAERMKQIMSELSNLFDEQKELFEALPKAIRIAQIWPDAFKDGLSCSPRIIGIAHSHPCLNPEYPKPYHDLKTITRTYLKRKDGVEYDISTEDFFSIITAGP